MTSDTICPSRDEDLTVVSWLSPASLTALLTSLAAVWLLMLLCEGGIADRAAFPLFYVAGHAWLVSGALLVTKIGLPAVYYTVAAVGSAVLAFRKRFKAAVLLILLVVSGRLFEQFQKAQFALARPDDQLHLAQTSTFAFPSGHTVNTTIAFVGAALLLAGTSRRWRWAVAAALMVTFLVGLSRLMLGVHWTTDVIGGWAFGGFWTIAWLRLADRLKTRELQVGGAS